MIDLLTDMLIQHEGIRLDLYECPAGKKTIGVGRNLEDNGISLDEAVYLLESDIARVERELQTFSFWRELNDARTAALCDMLFNLVLPRFQKFKKMLTALHAQDYTEAANQMLKSKWAGQVGKRAETLAYMVATGEECSRPT